MQKTGAYGAKNVRSVTPQTGNDVKQLPRENPPEPCDKTAKMRKFSQSTHTQQFTHFSKNFCKLLFIRYLRSAKIQGTYFKISALYFKIYGLYFLLHALCFFGTSGKGEKLSLYSYFIS